MFFNKNKKISNKKWLLSFGVVVSIAAVTASVISCSANTNSSNEQNTNNTKSTNTTTSTNSTSDINKINTSPNGPNSGSIVNSIPTSTSINLSPNVPADTIANITLSQQVLDNPLKVLNSYNQISTVSLPKQTQEEFILAKYYYSGQINDSTNGITALTPTATTITDSLEMRPGDSMVLVFNKDLKYNLKQMQAYINTLYFYDTSIERWAWWQPNLTLGGYMKFDNTGLSSPYFGSAVSNIQNPPAFGIWLAKIAPSYQDYPTAWKQLLTFCNYMKNESGEYVPRPTGYSRNFADVYPLGVIPKNLWVIKQVASNAFAFTYNANLNQIPAISNALIVQMTANDLASSNSTVLTPWLALGGNYEANTFLNPAGMWDHLIQEELPLGQILTQYTAPNIFTGEWKVNPNDIINTNKTDGKWNSQTVAYLTYLTQESSSTSVSNTISIAKTLPNNIVEKE